MLIALQADKVAKKLEGFDGAVGTIITIRFVQDFISAKNSQTQLIELINSNLIRLLGHPAHLLTQYRYEHHGVPTFDISFELIKPFDAKMRQELKTVVLSAVTKLEWQPPKLGDAS